MEKKEFRKNNPAYPYAEARAYRDKPSSENSLILQAALDVYSSQRVALMTRREKVYHYMNLGFRCILIEYI